MIKLLEKDMIIEISEYIEKINVGQHSVRYYPKELFKIKEKVEKRFLDEEVLTLIDYNDGIDGYFEIMLDKEQQYTQVLSHFSHIDYHVSLKRFFDFVFENYKGYKLHYVLGEHNTDSLRFMNQTKAIDEGFETMLLIKKEDFLGGETNHIQPLTKKYEQEFFTMHNNKYKDAYWTGELLLSEGKFDILILVEESVLKGYVAVSNFGRIEEEIYFITALTDIEKDTLYNAGLEVAFKRCEQVLLLLDQSENIELPALRDKGFKIKERIITYYIEEI